MDNETKKILDYDPLAETEKFLGGKNWSKFSDEEQELAIASVVIHNDKKRKHLESIGDTYFRMKWDDFIDLIESHGLVEALQYDISYDGSQDKQVLYYHPSRGYILWANSWNNCSSVNGGKLYLEIQGSNEDEAMGIWNVHATGGCVNKEKFIYYKQFDVREGLFSKLEELSEYGIFLPRWVQERKFLHFVDYVESDKEDYDCEEITQSKIERCPQAVRDIIGR